MPPEQINPYESYVQPGQQPGSNQRRKLILLAVIAGVFIGMALIFTLVAGKTKVIVNVESASNNEVTYRFVNQAKPDDITEIKDPSRHIEASLPNGTYELTVRQDETQYFSVVEAKGETTTVQARPGAEKGRRFVGNQPKECIYFLKTHLVSYDCGSGFDTLQVHVPATASLPTYPRTGSFPTQDLLEGIIQTKEGTIALTYEVVVAGHDEFARDTEPGHTPHVAFNFQSALKPNLANRTNLPDLGEERYSLQAYRDGFLAYPSTLTSAHYYAALGAKPVEVAIAGPGNTKLKPYALTARGSAFAIAYTAEGEGSDIDSEIVLQDGDQTRRYSFQKKRFDSIRLCGDKKLCGLHENALEVYDVSGETVQQLYTVSNVRDLAIFRGGLVIVRDTEVLNFDVDTQSGVIQYGFGDYNYCGVQPVDDTYLLCVTSDAGARSVLYIEQQQISDKIDQKVAQLMKVPEVSAVSTYGTLISISPNAGRLEYQPKLDAFGYEPDRLRQANAQINKKLNEIGIDRKKYQIKNTLE
ncbi:MAG TPA: hypothetical protein VK674_05925 [Candidatus Limnocylindria bacterium]|nr:hypothetical protein [Candidatus Limnocylindria bacterium]